MLDVWAQAMDSGSRWKSEFKAETMRLKLGDQSVLLMKPQTFMNLSGESVQPAVAMFKIPLTDVLVAHDEIDLPFGEIRFQARRGPGGHNGIKSIHQTLGSDEYCRLRLGVGRPPVFVDETGSKTRATMAVHDYVLQNFLAGEQKQLQVELLAEFIEATECWVKNGLEAASTRYNRPREQRGERHGT